MFGKARSNDDKTTRRSGGGRDSATSHNNNNKTNTIPNSNTKHPALSSTNRTTGPVGLGHGARKLSHDMKLNASSSADAQNITNNNNITNIIPSLHPSSNPHNNNITNKNNIIINKNNKNKKNNTNENNGGILFSDREDYIRAKARRCKLFNFFKTNIATLLVFCFYLITLETVLSCMLTVGLTLFWYFYVPLAYGPDSDSWSGGGIDWVVLGFAVVTPITVSIGMAFRRRELALFQITRVRSFSFQIYLAHSIWDWSSGNGRKNANINSDTNNNIMSSTSKASSHDNRNEETNALSTTDNTSSNTSSTPQNGYYNNTTNDLTTWLQHSDVVLEHLVGIGDELSRFLSLPTSSRTRHRMLRSGREEAAEIVELQYKLFDSLYTKRITKLTQMAEQLKTLGLSATETSRIRQFERYIGEAVEGLRMIKMYRTPQALRSFGRMFTIVLPPLYATSFTQLAFDLQSLPMGILFAFITPLCLTALFESMTNLEDPFVGSITLDGIDCVEELEVLHWHQLKNARSEIFPNAPSFEFRYSPGGPGSINGEMYWQQPKHGDIFDTTSYMTVENNIPPFVPTVRMDGSSRMSNFAKVRTTSRNTAGSIDGSDRVSHFAMDMSTGSRMRSRTAGLDRYVPRRMES